jgi:hypothetical protein
VSTAARLTAPRRDDPRRIVPLIAAVVAAHAMLLALPRQLPVAQGRLPAHAPAVQVRFVEPQRHDATIAQPLIATLDPAMAPARSALPAPAALPLSEQLPTQDVAAPASTALAVPLAPPERQWLGMALPGVPTEDDHFFARSALSVAPAALQPVLIDYPVFQGDAGRYVSELSLFIDETGSVVKVRVDGDALPPPLEAAARRAFLNARFRPGEAPEFGVVKSRIRVEVTFDNRDVTRGG